MQVRIFTVYDTKAEAYLQPFFSQSKGQAIRSFTEAVNDKNHQFGKYPEDFVLFEVGSFDDSSATFDLLAAPIALGVGVEFVRASA